MKRAAIFLIVFALTLGIAVGIAYQTGFFNSPVKNSASTPHMVSLLGSKADPEIVLAETGDFVQFNSKDGKEHNLAQGSGNASSDSHTHQATGIESGKFKGDEAYKVQFKKVGIYAFHDHYNPDLYIRVIVDDKKN